MKEIDFLIEKALKYKESGLTDHEIAEELNVSRETRQKRRNQRGT